VAPPGMRVTRRLSNISGRIRYRLAHRAHMWNVHHVYLAVSLGRKEIGEAQAGRSRLWRGNVQAASTVAASGDCDARITNVVVTCGDALVVRRSPRRFGQYVRRWRWRVASSKAQTVAWPRFRRVRRSWGRAPPLTPRRPTVPLNVAPFVSRSE